MAKRLSVKHRSRRRDQLTAYLSGQAPAGHKVAVARSRRAKLKKAYPMA